MKEQKKSKFDCEDSSEASLRMLETIFLTVALQHTHQGNEESAAPVFTTAIKFRSYYKILSLLSLISAFKWV